MSVSQGASVRAVADRLGHEDGTGMLQTYGHLFGGDEDCDVAATGVVHGRRRWMIFAAEEWVSPC